MAKVVVTLKVMPESPTVDMHLLEASVKKKIVHFAGETEFKVTIEPIAFGLKCLNVFFVMDEAKGSTDRLETDVATIKGVNSVEVSDVRRAIG
jgi:translation elongation factor aEF-1 beta